MQKIGSSAVMCLGGGFFRAGGTLFSASEHSCGLAVSQSNVLGVAQYPDSSLGPTLALRSIERHPSSLTFVRRLWVIGYIGVSIFYKILNQTKFVIKTRIGEAPIQSGLFSACSL
jgi:hypothetical protein